MHALDSTSSNSASARSPPEAVLGDRLAGGGVQLVVRLRGPSSGTGSSRIAPPRVVEDRLGQALGLVVEAVHARDRTVVGPGRRIPRGSPTDPGEATQVRLLA